MKKILISDWFDKFGGAEKVIQAICEIISFDEYLAYIDLMPSVVKEKVFGKHVDIKEGTILKKMGGRFRLLMPLFPLVVKNLNGLLKNERCDLIISSSWALSKGFKIKGAKHICYLQARNMKYVWDEADLYFTGLRRIFSFVKKYLQKFDVEMAQNPDILVSNSKFVQEWVKKHYQRDSFLIYPPVDVDGFNLVSEDEKEEYYITLGRIEPYKRFDIIIRAFNQNKKRLIVVGAGSQLDYLKRIAAKNIEFYGFLKKEEFKNVLSKARGFVYAGVEDFGIAIVEALASGVPVIGFSGGAMSELVEDGFDGVLFNQQNSDSLNSGINYFEQKYNSFNPKQIKERANRFSKVRFQNEFKELVDNFVKDSDLKK